LTIRRDSVVAAAHRKDASRLKKLFYHLVDEKTQEAMDKRSKMPEASLRLERLAARWKERSY
jgi:hypothetical protein